MKKIIIFLGGRPEQQYQIILLLLMGFFMGVFIAMYQVGVETLFLLSIGKEYLVPALIVSGVLGVMGTLCFVHYQNTLKYSSITITILFFIFLLVFGLQIILKLTGDVRITFIMFTLLSPIKALTFLVFWGAFGRIFDIRSAKRLIGGIDSGQLTATFITFMVIAFLKNFDLIRTENLLNVSVVGILCLFITSIILVRDFNIDTKIQNKSTQLNNKISYSFLFSNNYLKILCFFLIASTATKLLMENAYLGAMDIRYTEEKDLSIFLSFYDAAVVGMTFIIQTTVSDYILANFGIKTSLMIMPFVLSIFCIGSVITGHIYGYQENDSDYLFFFLFTAIGRVLGSSTKDAIETLSFKNCFLPLNPKIRLNIQSRIEGVVNESSSFILGIILLGLGSLNFFTTIHYFYINIILLVTVLILASLLYDEYKIAIKRSLMSQKQEIENVNKNNIEAYIMNNIILNLQENHYNNAIIGLNILEKIDVILYKKYLIYLLEFDNIKIREFIYTKCFEYNNFHYLEEIKIFAEKETIPVLKEQSKKLVEYLAHNRSYLLDYTESKKITQSTNKKNKIFLSQLLSQIKKDDKHLLLLIDLLKDSDPDVRKAAIISTTSLHYNELYHLLIDNLSTHTYSLLAKSSLILQENVVHLIDAAFYRTEQNRATMLLIVQILGRIGNQDCVNRLWKKTDFHDKIIVNEVFYWLSFLNYKAKGIQRERIKTEIQSLFSKIVWNLNCIQSLIKFRHHEETEYLTRLIIKSLKNENEKNNEQIFNLMILLYDTQSVILVKENINEKNIEGITFALEMLDIFLDVELKEVAFIIFDDNHISNKVDKLSTYYPIIHFKNNEDILLSIINRGYNNINHWIKVLALLALKEMEHVPLNQSISACIFHKNKLIYETSAYIIYSKDKRAYEYYSQLLDINIKKELDKVLLSNNTRTEIQSYGKENTKKKIMLLSEKILFISKIFLFKHIPEDILANIIESFKYVILNEKKILVDQNIKKNEFIYILLHGEVLLYNDSEQILDTLYSGSVIGLDTILEYQANQHRYIAQEKTELLVLPAVDFFEAAGKYKEIVTAIFLETKHLKVFENTIQII